ncbi:MAG TPA: hypothetical protein VGG49_02410 [Steroidobacteraceae bacterium]|jgi:hypothetical protein
MGWSFGWKSQETLVAQLLSEDYGRTIDHELVGNHLWTVKESPAGERGIVLFKLDRVGTWGYKAMGESVGPYAWDCPMRMLDAVPAQDSDWARKWREKVRFHHAARVEVAA